MTTVLVTDASRGSAVATIRSLARAGHRVIAADSARLSPGRWSRYAAGRARYPDASLDTVGAGKALARAAHEGAVRIIIPVTDAAIAALEVAADDLPPDCRVAAPPPSDLDLVRHKTATLDLARSVGVPIPDSTVVRTCAEAAEAAAALGWPVVLKPEQSTVETGPGTLAKFDVAYATDEMTVCRHMARFEGACAVLVQEYCAGEGLGVEVLAHEGRVLRAFQHRRLREVPFSGGASSLREAVALDPVLMGHTSKLIAALGWTGLAMVEFKMSDNGPRLMEVNGRLWGSLPLAVRAGVDFPAELVDLMVNGPPSRTDACRPYAVGTRSRNVRLEVLWAAAVLAGTARHPVLPAPRRREGVAVLAQLLRPSDGYDMLSWHDPGPGIADLIRLCDKAVPDRWRR